MDKPPALDAVQKELKKDKRLKVNRPLQPRKPPLVRAKRRRRQRVMVQKRVLKRAVKLAQVPELAAHCPQHHIHKARDIRNVKVRKKVVFKHLQLLRRRPLLKKLRHKPVAQHCARRPLLLPKLQLY